jgi:hypothetical protein
MINPAQGAAPPFLDEAQLSIQRLRAGVVVHA